MTNEKRKVVPGRRVEDVWTRWEKRTRDLIIFGIGAAGVVNELWFVETIRLEALAFLSAVLGVPFALFLDEKRKREHERDIGKGNE